MDALKSQICTREEFVQTYGKPGLGEKQAAILDKHGIFPLTYRNPKLARLNVLGLYVYFSGGLRVSTKNSYSATISKGRAQQHDISDKIESELGLTLKKRISKKEKNDDLKKRYDLNFGQNGGPYARLLSLMGF